jgi:prepilin-type N-terminal cleavage/methylation domain-containing protein
MKRGQNKQGFTIVELLIVIIVIAILATITIVLYNGVQQRANNAKVAKSVSTYLNLFALYKSMNAQYPTPTTSGTMVCLGTEYTNDRCWLSNKYEDPALMATLQTTAGSANKLPSSDYGGSLKGITYSPSSVGNTLDGTATNFIAYIVMGSSTKCPVGPVATFVSGIQFSSTPPASGQSVAPNAFGDVQCWVALP